jgi:peptidoglycan/LPS O-acetylase OafA/YrhL
MKTLPNLTSIRFFLATLVVIFHIPQFCRHLGFPYFNDLPIFNKGLESVYMFFSLSGFLIIKLLYIEKENTATVKLKDFFLRRILRIFPLYYLVLTFGFLYYHVIVPFMGFKDTIDYDLPTAIALSMTFFPNILHAYNPGAVLQVLWSIGIEEQFYLFIAPLLLLIPTKRIVIVLSLFTIIYFGLYFSDYFADLRQFQMFFYYFSFSGICGIFLSKQGFKKIISKIKYPVFVIFILYFTTNIFVDLFSAMIYHFFSMLLFGLSICALVSKPISFLENPKMIYLGKISYGIYMFHMIVIQVVGFVYLKFISKMNLPEIVSILFLNFSVIIGTIIISHFSYKYYETFFLNLKQKFRAKPTK